jgi:hypothetical protein
LTLKASPQKENTEAFDEEGKGVKGFVSFVRNFG